MRRYYLQEGDGVDVTGTEIMLVMTTGRLSLSPFDVPALDLRFHWMGVPHPVGLDDRGFYVDVDDDTYRAMSGLDAPDGAAGAEQQIPAAPAPPTRNSPTPLADAAPLPPGFDVAALRAGNRAQGLAPNGAPFDGWLQAPSLGSWFALDRNGVMWQMPIYRWEPASAEPHAFDADRVADAFEVPGYDEDAYPGAAPDELPDFAALREIRAQLESRRGE